MKIDRILFPIETLGPGRRMVIWTKGCSKHCLNCANPELWENEKAQDISVKELANIITQIHNETPIEGITISGGDPLEQGEELLELLEAIVPLVEDILVYTGYVYEQLEQLWEKVWLDKLKRYAAVLIDGPYIEGLNDNLCGLRGSTNQRLLYFKEKYREPYEVYMEQGRKIQNVYMGNRLISVGIHNREEGELHEET